MGSSEPPVLGRAASGEAGQGCRARSTHLGDPLVHNLLCLATGGLPRAEFLRSVSSALAEAAGCEAVELWLREEPGWVRTRLATGPDERFELSSREAGPAFAEWFRPGGGAGDARATESRVRTTARSFFVKGGCAWSDELEGAPGEDDAGGPGALSSVAVLPFTIVGGIVGWLQLGSRMRHYFGAESVGLLRRVAETLALVVVGQGAEAALRERVKELTCLYSLAQVAERPGISLEELLQGVAELLPPAWQYPEIAVARIEVEGMSCSTSAFDRTVASQKAAIVIRGEVLGRIEVGYTSERPGLDEGPFLSEERSLVDAVARELAAVIERRRAAEERTLLEGQLLHADRLATIGQLAAGLAHELNEPLAAILGFAQLSQKADGLPEEPRRDLGKIAAAALHAREIVRKLMLFARQTTPRAESLDLNEVVRDGLELLGSRCARDGIDVRCFLEEGLPRITADRSQLQQVLINLMVNALQAMPEGGRLAIRTRSAEDSVALTVQDDGVGMDEEVKGQIFLPFFTTKDVDQGTGLGLAVVHGIVASHGGSIVVESELGRGSTFEVELPLDGIEDDTKEAGGALDG